MRIVINLQILSQIILTFIEIICLSLEVNKTGTIKNTFLDI